MIYELKSIARQEQKVGLNHEVMFSSAGNGADKWKKARPKPRGWGGIVMTFLEMKSIPVTGIYFSIEIAYELKKGKGNH